MTDELAELFERADLQTINAFNRADLLNWNLTYDALPFIVPATTPETIICQGCEESCRMPITKQHGKISIWCDKSQNMGKITVEPEELDLWRVDMQLLANLLTELLDTPTAKSIDNCRTYDLGIIENHTLFLIRGLNWDGGTEICSEPIIHNSHPIIISLSLPPEGCSFPTVWLGQLLNMKTGKLCADKERLLVALGAPTVMEGNIFYKNGDYWHIRFEGKEANIKHSNGMVYIDYLLHSPHKEIAAINLQGLINKVLPKNTHLFDEATDDPSILKSDLVIDEKALIQIRAKLALLREKKPNSSEIPELEAFLRTNMHSGKSRKFTNDNEKARTAVSKAINSAKKKFEKTVPAFFAHIKANIHTGTVCRYAPTDNIKWS